MERKKRTALFGLVVLCACSAGSGTRRGSAASPPATDLASARDHRDRGDVAALGKTVAIADERARRLRSFEAYLRLAVLQSWMCEAAEARRDGRRVREAARAGIAAAEKAAALDPESSEAHQVLADLLSQLIPHVFGGGMRYGKRSTDEADKAIALDPDNASAYVTRAIIYLYTPPAFGGSKAKAFEMLTKAASLEPEADTPHIWLAQAHAEAGRTEAALAEAREARRLNPDRLFARDVFERLAAGRGR